MLNDDEVCNCRNLNNESTSNVTPAQSDTPAENPAQTGNYEYNAPAANYEFPAGNAPIKKKSFFKSKLFIGIAAGVAVAAIAVTVVLLVLSNNPQTKVYNAFTKTFKDSGRLFEDISKFNYTGKESTVKISGEYEDYSLEAYATLDGNDKGFGAKLLEGKSVIFAVDTVLDKSGFKVGFPDTGYKKIFVYDYNVEDEDEIEEFADAIDIRESMITEINTYVKALYELSPSDSSLTKDMKSVLKKWFKDLKFEKAEKETFEIDDEDRDCSGYEITITGEDVYRLIEDLYELVNKEFSEQYEDLEWDDIERSLDRVQDKLEDIEDIIIDIYMYDGKLAAFILGDEKEKLTVEFNGGDYRMQNVVAYMGKKSSGEIFRIKGSRTDSKETMSFIFERYEKVEYKYNFDSGKVEVAFYEDYEDSEPEVTVDFKVETGSSSFALTLGKIKSGRNTIDLSDYNLRVEVSSKGSIAKTKGTEVDVLKSDPDDLKDEFNDLKDELMDAISGTDLMSLFYNMRYLF